MLFHVEFSTAMRRAVSGGAIINWNIEKRGWLKHLGALFVLGFGALACFRFGGGGMLSKGGHSIRYYYLARRPVVLSTYAPVRSVSVFASLQSRIVFLSRSVFFGIGYTAFVLGATLPLRG